MEIRIVVFVIVVLAISVLFAGLFQPCVLKLN